VARGKKSSTVNSSLRSAAALLLFSELSVREIAQIVSLSEERVRKIARLLRGDGVA